MSVPYSLSWRRVQSSSHISAQQLLFIYIIHTLQAHKSVCFTYFRSSLLQMKQNKNVVYQFGVGQDFQQCNESDAVLQIFDQVVHSKRWNSLRKINKKKSLLKHRTNNSTTKMNGNTEYYFILRATEWFSRYLNSGREYRCERFPHLNIKRKKIVKIKICGFSLFLLSVAFQIAALFFWRMTFTISSLPLDVKKKRKRQRVKKSPTSMLPLLHYTKGYIQIVGHGARIWNLNSSL